MSELKTYGMNDPEVGDEYEMYKVSDVDKVIAHHKYKRCLAMAKWCESEANKCLTQQCALICFPETDRFQYLEGHIMHFSKWHRRWLKLAEKFKEVK